MSITRIALVACLVLQLLIPAMMAGQVIQDTYWVNGRQVSLAIHLDSFAVVTVAPVPGSVAVEMVDDALPGADSARVMSSTTWILVINTADRGQLRDAIHEVGEVFGVKWAGFLVRTTNAVEPAIVTNEFIVQFAAGLSRTEIDSLNSQNGVEIVRPPSLWPNHFVLRVTPDSPLDALAMANLYRSDPRTVFAHPNFISRVSSSTAWTPNDALLSQQWHIATIQAEDAWDIERGNSNVVIAIIEDDGFFIDHEDLWDNRWTNPWESGAGSGPEPFAKIGDINGWNFRGCPTLGSTDPLTDDCGSSVLTPTAPIGSSAYSHGTQVAGVAAARADNVTGISGVCPYCSLMYIRMDLGSADTQAHAIAYANLMGADVINLSFNTPYYQDTYVLAINDAAYSGRDGRGIPVIASTANYNMADDPLYCTYEVVGALDAVITINRSHPNDQRNVGATGPCLDLISPGIGILTSSAGNTYVAVNGNSFAAPVVAGVAGLILSRNPTLTRDEVYETLTTTAVKIGNDPYDPSGRNDTHGYGRVNAHAALMAVPPIETPDEWEVGLRLGVSATNGGTTRYEADLPGEGPLSEPVFYASWFATGYLMVDVQLGLNRVWGAGVTTEERLALGWLAAYRVSVPPGFVYVGPSVAFRSINLTGSPSNAWGYGSALGYRIPLGTKVAARLETRYRWWSLLGLNEWGAAVGLGVRLP